MRNVLAHAIAVQKVTVLLVHVNHVHVKDVAVNSEKKIKLDDEF